MSRLLRLYPRPWRERYGDEMAAILAARPLRVADRLDLVLGALDAHLRVRRSPAAAATRRVVEVMAVLAGSAWVGAVAGFGVASSMTGGIAIAALTLAVVLVIAMGATVLWVLPSRAACSLLIGCLPALVGTTVMVGGWLALVVGGDGATIAGLPAYLTWILGAMLAVLGIVIGALLLLRAGILPVPTARGLALGAAIQVACICAASVSGAALLSLVGSIVLCGALIRSGTHLGRGTVAV